MFKDFSACTNVLAANQQYPGNIKGLFRLQKCLSRKSTISWKIIKDFSACRIALAANQQNTGKLQGLFRLQNCLSRK